MYLVIGLCQCLAMIPGVSRSGATIVSAMLLGADKRSAAEFSFFLAMPTMVGAFAYDLYKSCGADERASNTLIVAVGFAVSFVAAWIVVKTFLDYVHAPRLRAVRLVARDRRHARPDRAGARAHGRVRLALDARCRADAMPAPANCPVLRKRHR